MENTVEIQIIDNILKILDAPEKWIKGEVAQNQHGDEIHYANPKATCWCLEGALHKAFWEHSTAEVHFDQYYSTITNAMCYIIDREFEIEDHERHIGFNDNSDTTYPMVIDMLKKTKVHLQGE